MERPKRKKMRLEGYDYSSAGMYFVTLCLKDRENLFWSRRGDLYSPEKVIKQGRGDLQSPEGSVTSGDGRMQFAPTNDEPPELSQIGIIVEREILKLSTIYPGVYVERYRIMPEHIHMIVAISKDQTDDVRPQLSRIIKQFKSSVTKQLGISLWQKSYYDRIIRSQEHLENVWNYVEYNHLKPHKNMP